MFDRLCVVLWANDCFKMSQHHHWILVSKWSVYDILSIFSYGGTVCELHGLRPWAGSSDVGPNKVVVPFESKRSHQQRNPNLSLNSQNLVKILEFGRNSEKKGNSEIWLEFLNLVEIPHFSWSSEIWLNFLNLVEILKYGWYSKIWMKFWNLVKIMRKNSWVEV